MKEPKTKRGPYRPREKSTEQPEKGSYGQKLMIAQSLGYKGVAEAIAAMGKYEFMQKCKSILGNDHHL